MWVCSGSALVAEICVGAGLDWLLIDAEHSPNSLESVLAQLQAARAYPAPVVVRVEANDPVLIKRYLDLGATSLLIPMVNNAAEAQAAVAATRYPPEGVRGVGSALARSGRWSRIPGYLNSAAESLTVLVQLESVEAVRNAAEIATVDGVDGVFVGPSDLAASMGFLGQQDHPDVVVAAEECIRAAKAASKFVGINAFAPALAQHYVATGADFIAVGADVTLLARGSEALAQQYVHRAADTAEFHIQRDVKEPQ